ncbi:hypothetical protein D5H75_35745 [Bailinhaonella thermotolerans]|uniref:Uncharacterized protein n=2 Tax=Bailinhaonella thermotolerans TaxID=1070861 RepID=A0A3A4AAW1_9ACTN|nr:hypothetical protein D5H75_35745 [Bailinhaonella thermotolerans]
MGTPGGACPHHYGETTISAVTGLRASGAFHQGPGEFPGPWGERDGVLRLPGRNPAFMIDLAVTLNGHTSHCRFGLVEPQPGWGYPPDVEIEVFNRDRPGRPDPAVDELQLSGGGELHGPDQSDVCGYGGLWIDATRVTGETTPGSGVFDQTLHLTGAP